MHGSVKPHLGSALQRGFFLYQPYYQPSFQDCYQPYCQLYYKSKMNDRASNNGTPPPISQTPPPIVQVEVVIPQPPIIAISPGKWTELAAVVERYARDQSMRDMYLMEHNRHGQMPVKNWLRTSVDNAQHSSSSRSRNRPFKQPPSYLRKNLMKIRI